MRQPEVGQIWMDTTYSPRPTRVRVISVDRFMVKFKVMENVREYGFGVGEWTIELFLEDATLSEPDNVRLISAKYK